MLLFLKVDIVAEYVNAKRMTVVVHFFTKLKQTVLNSWHVKTTGVRKGERAFSFPGNWD